MKQAAIFDLDGVIVDTARFHYLAWKRLAAGWASSLPRLRTALKRESAECSPWNICWIPAAFRTAFPRRKKRRWRRGKPVVRGADRHTDGKGPAARRRTPFERAEGCRVAVVLGSASKNAPPILKEPWNTGAVRRRGGWKYGSGGQAGSSGVYLGSRAGGNPL